jgi:hypothetical protein
MDTASANDLDRVNAVVRRPCGVTHTRPMTWRSPSRRSPFAAGTP